MASTKYGWTEILDPEAYEAAMACARGRYQRALLDGRESLSGSTLRGKAAHSGGCIYARSRAALLRRMRAAGVPFGERRGEHGRRILVIGEVRS